MKVKHLLGLSLATSQRLARLRFLVLLMVLLVLMVVIVVLMVIVGLGRSVDNPQTSRVVGLQRGRAAAVFLHLVVNIGRFLVGVIVAKLSSRALVDGVEGRCLLLVVDCSRVVDRVVVRLSFEVHRALHVLQLGRGRQDGNQ